MFEALLVPWVSLSLATAICSMWQLYNPILAKLPEDHLLNRNPILCKVSWFILATIIAPVLVPVIAIEEYRLAYIAGFVIGSTDE